MGAIIKDPVGFLMGVLDLLSGILLWFTIAPLPALMSQFHAGFLVIKGAGTLIRPIPLRTLGVPFFVLGGAADLLSAAILFVGNPPILADYKTNIAIMLGLKGIYTLLMFMQ